MNGKVFHIQRFSLHDGPGIRTTFFLMGCSLRCRWCHNPEGLSDKIQLQFSHKDCVFCGACQTVCESDVHTIDKTGHRVDFSRCTVCGRCMEICPTHALAPSGAVYTPEALAEAALRDCSFYREKGGVTFSGGEPLLQPEFVAQTAKLCRKGGVPSIAVDTAGNVSWAAFETVLPLTDFFLFDVKAATEAVHIAGTGVSNRLILENLRRLDRCGKQIYIRIPVIPTVNDSEAEIAAIGTILTPLQNLCDVRLLPYHTFGREKYETLGFSEPACFPLLAEEKQKVLETALKTSMHADKGSGYSLSGGTDGAD